MKKSIILNVEDIQYYIKDIRKIPVITHDRQNQIFDQLTTKGITKEEKDKLYKELILGNLRFVISVAKMYQNQGLDIMDLISEGNIGLMRAAEKFDPSSGYRFISYAVWWVRQSIMASLNEHSRTIRIPSNVVLEVQKQKKKDNIPQEDAYSVDLDEDRTNQNLPYCVGFYNPINDEGDMLIDIIPNVNAGNPEELLNSPEEIKKKVSLMLNVLDERERTIITKYYGLTGVESSLDDLGDEFKCTKERIRQLKDKAIKKLRNESFSLLNYL